MNDATQMLGQLRTDKQAAAKRGDEDVLREVAEVRRQLDRIEDAVKDGHRVPGGVSGRSFFTGDAQDLSEAMTARQRAHEDLYEVEGLLKRIGAEVPA